MVLIKISNKDYYKIKVLVNKVKRFGEGRAATAMQLLLGGPRGVRTLQRIRKPIL